VDRLATVDEEMIDFIDFKDRDVNIRILHTKMGLSVGQSGKKKTRYFWQKTRRMP